MSQMFEFPIGYHDVVHNKWYKQIELQKLDSEELMIFGESKKNSNPYLIFQALLQKSVVSIQNDSNEVLADHRSKIKNMKFRDAVFAVSECIILTKKNSKITTSYKCPRGQHYITFDLYEDEEGNEIDTREDFRKVKLNILSREDLASLDKDGCFLFEAKEGFQDQNEQYTLYQMQYPTLQTYIDVYNYTDNPLEQEKEALYRSMVSMNGLDESEMIRLKTKFGRRIFLPDIEDYQRLSKQMRSIGYNLNEHKVTCRTCGGFTFQTTFDLSNFFGSILPV